MIRLFLEPLDLWLFRDGRPFTAGADHHAHSMFPPSPLTLYGALRTKLLFGTAERSGANVTDSAFVERTVGAADDFERFTLRGPLLGRCEQGTVTRLFPAPLDLARFEPRDAHAEEWQILTPQRALNDRLGLITDHRLALPWAASTGRPEAAAGRWLDEASFFATLLGQARPAIPAGALYQVERRSGIELDGTGSGAGRRVVREGRLYSVAFVRPAPGVGLCLDLDGLDGLGSSGLLGLGGEGRASRYEAIPAATPSRAAARDRVAQTGRPKVVLVTPALFAAGWLPAWVDARSRATTNPVAGLRLVAAAVGRPAPIGGFDIRARRPRPIRQAVPAGSVYWFEEVEAGAAARAFDALDGRCISDEYARIGFGQCYVGGW